MACTISIKLGVGRQGSIEVAGEKRKKIPDGTPEISHG